MTKFPFTIRLLLLTLMTPVAAFGSLASTPGSTLEGIQQQHKYHRLATVAGAVAPSSSLSLPFQRSFRRRTRSTIHESHSSRSSDTMGTHLKMCADISAPSVSLVTHVVERIRGGAVAGSAVASLTPTKFFNTCLLAVAMSTMSVKVLQAVNSKRGNSGTEEKTAKIKPESVKDLQRRFLSVFWLLRCADWLQGPYFYMVYASKSFGGAPASMAMISRLFLTGFASTALFGPTVGRAIDTYGRKKGTLAFSVLYAMGALSTKSPLLAVLLFGRVMSGIGTSLLFSAPESWLVGESQKSGVDPDGEYLGETFGLAYAGDSVVAIIAGQLASLAATQRGPTGPFELSTGFLAAGGLLAALMWKENLAAKSGSDDSSGKPSIKDAIKVIRDDPKIMMVGGVQSLFEAAMYIFVLQWPPALAAAVGKYFGEGAGTPYGTVFSCFMACCLFGSTLFGQFAKMKGPTTEGVTTGMLAIATIAMSTATYTVSSASAASSLPALVASFFAFEACVGMYFPSIGTLRSKYIPDSHRSVIMNLFGIPLNVLVVSVFMFVKYLGVNGALGISSAALALATLCMVKLNGTLSKEAKPAVA